jgi:BRCA1-associated protein
MPDYFFHVALEVTEHPSAPDHDLERPDVSRFFTALKPFTDRKRTQRDPKYDSRSLGAPKTSHTVGSDRLVQSRTSDPHDHRSDTVFLEGIDMEGNSKTSREAGSMNGEHNIVSKGIGSAMTDSYLKGHFSPVDQKEIATSSWGIVHLYRDADPTPSLSLRGSAPYQYSDLWSNTPQSQPLKSPHAPPADSDCTTLCILAVPSYMTPADFLAFVGEKTRDAVSHFRMVRTKRQNRYMVLMKFREGKTARKWQAEWDGKIWNAMEPETCHVVFLKSVELVVSSPGVRETTGSESTFPQLTSDPFGSSAPMRPLPPPTPSLIELPTCPVCLERMDETTGLLTIPCQHVFHCTCLQKWSGGGCPVCRYTHDDFSSRAAGMGKKRKKKILNTDGTTYEYEVADDEALECETCHEDGGSLWQCLICGRVGCGRYEGKHAYAHYEKSGHMFAMDLASKRVWDYRGDGYVHRIIVEEGLANKDGTEVGVREVGADSDFGGSDTYAPGKGDTATNPALENLALEYTHLLTSQLESQRVYFEEILERAVDKASDASRKADRAEQESAALNARLTKLESENDFVTKGRVPELEKENARLTTRARKLEEMAKDINTKYLEERSTSKGLLERIEHLENTELKALKIKIQGLEEDNATKDLLMEGLREEHRDAMVQVGAAQKLQEMIARGEIDASELEGAEVTVGKKPLSRAERLKERLEAEREVRSKGKGKGKS